MVADQLTPEQIEGKFRDSLAEVIEVLKRIEPLCNNVDEAIGLLELGIQNDAQLRLLLNRILKVRGKG